MSTPKHIGILAVSAEGAALCYRTLCIEAGKLLGQNKTPRITLHQIAFDQHVKAQQKDDWEKVAKIILGGIQVLKQSGAQMVIIPANSTHFCIEDLKKKSSLPIISMIDIVVQECVEKRYKKLGVLGVGITMEKGLFMKPLKAKGTTSLVPGKKEQKIINDIIYNEIIPGRMKSNSIQKITNMISNFKKQGCQAVILGCTELPIIINNQNSPLPCIDTTRLLAKKAVEYAIEIPGKTKN